MAKKSFNVNKKVFLCKKCYLEDKEDEKGPFDDTKYPDGAKHIVLRPNRAPEE